MARQTVSVLRMVPMGLHSNANPHTLKSGEAQEQVNLRSDVPGRWRCRGGMRPVSFENSSTASSSSIITLDTFKAPHASFVVFELADGTVKAGRNPT